MAVNVSEDGRSAVTSGGNNNETFVWSVANGKTITRLCGAGRGIWGIGWAKDGKSIAWGTDNHHDLKEISPLEGTFRFDDFGVGHRPDETQYNQWLRDDPLVKLERLDLTDLDCSCRQQPVVFRLPGKERILLASGASRSWRKGDSRRAASLVMIDSQSGKLPANFRRPHGTYTATAPSPDGKLFATGHPTRRFASAAGTARPVMIDLVAGRDWIAWTTQGFYACSPQGERLIAWQVNAAATPGGKLPVVHPAARFRPSMYQPAVIKYLIPAGNVQFALAMAQKFDQSLAQATSVADVLPPEVELVSPTGEAGTTDGNVVSVKATAKGNGKQPITAMRLLVDGRPFEGSSGVRRFDKPQATAEATWEVPVLPGPHSFAIIAESAVSKGMSKAAVVTRSGTPPKPNLYVLSMGVSDYPGDMKLHYAASDAKMLAEAFQARSRGVFATIEVRVVTDSQATKKGMQDGLDWLKSKMTAKDVGIVSFSGHGTRDPFGQFYLVPVDIRRTILLNASPVMVQTTAGNMPVGRRDLTRALRCRERASAGAR